MTQYTEENQKLSPDPMLELFDFDASNIGGGVYYFYSGGLNDATIIWKGNSYVPMPIMAEGWEFVGKGSLPTPTFKISNIARLMSTIINDIGDPLGATVKRWITFERFLDGGSEPDPDAHRTVEIYQVERKVNENNEFVEYELSAAIDQDGRMLPFRQVHRNFCPLRYRTYTEADGFNYVNATCPYTGDGVAADEGPFFDALGQPVGSPSEDVPSKKLDTCCKIRFDPQGEALPFGGFPGVGRIKRQ